MYRLFEHTADFGFHVEADTLPALLAETGRALVSLLVERPAAVQARDVVTVSLTADRLDDLLFDYLSELVYRFSAHGFVPAEQAIETDGVQLRATLRGEPYDAERHGPGCEVKAATYHGLTLERTDAGYVAEVIVDV